MFKRNFPLMNHLTGPCNVSSLIVSEEKTKAIGQIFQPFLASGRKVVHAIKVLMTLNPHSAAALISLTYPQNLLKYLTCILNECVILKQTLKYFLSQIIIIKHAGPKCFYHLKKYNRMSWSK